MSGPAWVSCRREQRGVSGGEARRGLATRTTVGIGGEDTVGRIDSRMRITWDCTGVCPGWANIPKGASTSPARCTTRGNAGRSARTRSRSSITKLATCDRRGGIDRGGGAKGARSNNLSRLGGPSRGGGFLGSLRCLNLSRSNLSARDTLGCCKLSFLEDLPPPPSHLPEEIIYFPKSIGKKEERVDFCPEQDLIRRRRLGYRVPWSIWYFWAFSVR